LVPTFGSPDPFPNATFKTGKECTMNMILRPTLKFGLVIACALGAVTPALAKESGQTTLTADEHGNRTARVRFADLEIAQLAGEAALRKRIDAAITILCDAPPPEGTFTSSPRGGFLVCKRRTREAVDPQVDALIAAARSGRQLAVQSIGLRVRRTTLR
jgi:UrcA family protein